MRRIYDSAVEECVQFIYCPRNRQIMANGSKTVTLSDGTSVILPQVKRRMSLNDLFRNYVKNMTEEGNRKTISRRSFLRIATRLTSGQTRSKKCLDYCLGVLVFDNVHKLDRVLNSYIIDVQVREQLKKELDSVVEYLKHDYVTELRDYGDPATAMKPALVGDVVEGAEGEQSRGMSRNDNCFKVLQVIENIREAISTRTASV